MQIDALGARPLLEEREGVQMHGLAREALGHHPEHLVAARGVLDIGGRDYRHQDSGERIETVFAPDLFSVSAGAESVELVDIETRLWIIIEGA